MRDFQFANELKILFNYFTAFTTTKQNIFQVIFVNLCENVVKLDKMIIYS
jgi:hypothetical protein